MRRPLISLFVAIVFFVLGGSLVSPLTPSSKRVVIGPEGRTMQPKTDAEVRADKLRVWRVNWPAYACFAAGTASFGWTLFLVSYGIVAVIKRKRQPDVPENIID